MRFRATGFASAVTRLAAKDCLVTISARLARLHNRKETAAEAPNCVIFPKCSLQSGITQIIRVGKKGCQSEKLFGETGHFRQKRGCVGRNLACIIVTIGSVVAARQEYRAGNQNRLLDALSKSFANSYAALLSAQRFR
jgi:hypothetical protein